MTTKPLLQGYRNVGDQVTTTNWNDMLSFGLWTQEMLAGTNGGEKISPAGCALIPQNAKNILTNPGFEIWQRGVGPFDGSVNATGSGADGWMVAGGTSTRDGATTDSGVYSLKFQAYGAGAAIYQLVYDAQRYRGVQLSATARVIGGTGFLQLNDDYNTYYGAAGGSGGFTTLNVTGQMSPNTTQINLGFIAQQNTLYYLDSFMLTQTPGPVAYIPLPPAEEWYRARRRYMVLPFHCRFHNNVASEPRQFTIPFPQMMLPGNMLAPSVTMGGTVNNIAAISVSGYGPTYVTLVVTAGAAIGDCYALGNTIIVDGGVY